MKKEQIITLVSAIIAAIIIICLVVVFTNRENKNLINPKAEVVAEKIKNVPSITEIKVVSENEDVNKQLNKKGGYTGLIYFASDLVKQDPIAQEEGQTQSLLELGTKAGGAIEIFPNKKDAKERNEYLAKFDGGPFASGGHEVYGTIVVRTSPDLTAEQQKELEKKIFEAIEK